MAELVGEVAVMESENTRLRDERMREEGRRERIAALEAENARLLAALEAILTVRDGKSLTWPEIDEIARQALAGDDSALKAGLDAAREEGREEVRANYGVIVKEELARFEQERDLLRAQLADDSPGTPLGIIKALFEFAEAECGHNPASARHALTTVTETIATLRAQLAERDAQIASLYDQLKEQDGIIAGLRVQIGEFRTDFAQLARQLAEAERKRDEYLVQREDMQTKRKCDQLAAQVERLRGVADDVVQGGGIADLEDARAALAETPAASLAAIRDQARREALGESAAIVEDADIETCGGYERQDDGRATLRAAAKAVRDLAAQPAKEPQS